MSHPVFLSPGEVHCSGDEAVVSTILGSCVAVCLWDKHKRLGGMNHFLLPRHGISPPTTRYGDVAFASLLAEIQRMGAKLGDVRAKLFGGAAVLPFGNHAETVGTQNVAVALEALRQHQIPLLARRTGGQRGLFIRFHTAIGRVMVRELASSTPVDAGAAAAIIIRGSKQDVGEVRRRFPGGELRD